MAWPKADQIKAERSWFAAACDEVGAKCGGSCISGRRTAPRNESVGGHPTSLHLDGLAQDWVFETDGGYANAWAMGRTLGLHGYKKPASLGIHWQARPAKRAKA